MGKASYSTKEIRFVFEEELTQVFFFIEAEGDCPIGVQGSHHKTFPKSMSALEILGQLAEGKEDPVMWGLEAPE